MNGSVNGWVEGFENKRKQKRICINRNSWGQRMSVLAQTWRGKIILCIVPMALVCIASDMLECVIGRGVDWKS